MIIILLHIYWFLLPIHFDRRDEKYLGIDCKSYIWISKSFTNQFHILSEIIDPRFQRLLYLDYCHIFLYYYNIFLLISIQQKRFEVKWKLQSLDYEKPIACILPFRANLSRVRECVIWSKLAWKTFQVAKLV